MSTEISLHNLRGVRCECVFLTNSNSVTLEFLGRNDEFLGSTRLVVYFDTPEEALKLALPLADDDTRCPDAERGDMRFHEAYRAYRLCMASLSEDTAMALLSGCASVPMLGEVS